MAANPVRLQAYFPKETYKRLRQKSIQLGVSMAEVIRQAVQEYLDDGGQHETPHPEDPIWRLPDLAETYGRSSLRDGAENHDRYIYDEDKS